MDYFCLLILQVNPKNSPNSWWLGLMTKADKASIRLRVAGWYSAQILHPALGRVWAGYNIGLDVKSRGRIPAKKTTSSELKSRSQNCHIPGKPSGLTWGPAALISVSSWDFWLDINSKVMPSTSTKWFYTLWMRCLDILTGKSTDESSRSWHALRKTRDVLIPYPPAT